MPAPPHPDDPRLRIPEILQTPHPAAQPGRPAQASSLSGIGELGKALALGFDFLFTSIAGGVLGWLIDRWLGSSPYGLLIGLVLGFLAGTTRLISTLNRREAKEKAARTKDAR